MRNFINIINESVLEEAPILDMDTAIDRLAGHPGTARVRTSLEIGRIHWSPTLPTTLQRLAAKKFGLTDVEIGAPSGFLSKTVPITINGDARQISAFFADIKRVMEKYSD
jgi:hypothetical protein